MEIACLRKASLALGAGIIGGMQRAGVSNAVGPVPWKLIAWPILLAAEAFVENDYISAIAGGLGDATLSTYADRAISTGGAYPTWNVAGELP